MTEGAFCFLSGDSPKGLSAVPGVVEAGGKRAPGLGGEEKSVCLEVDGFMTPLVGKMGSVDALGSVFTSLETSAAGSYPFDAAGAGELSVKLCFASLDFSC